MEGVRGAGGVEGGVGWRRVAVGRGGLKSNVVAWQVAVHQLRHHRFLRSDGEDGLLHGARVGGWRAHINLTQALRQEEHSILRPQKNGFQNN